MITLENLNMENIAVSFDNEYGLPVKELIKILSRKKYQDGDVKLVGTKNGLAIVLVEPTEVEK